MDVRARRKEIMDDSDVPESEIIHSLRYMTWVNRYFGGVKVILKFLERNRPPSSFTVLDLATGAGDIPLAIARWASAKGLNASITAIDVNDHSLRYAARHHSAPNIRYLKHSVFEFETLGTFDYIFSSMFFHHLDDEDIVTLLRRMAVQSRRGFLVNDLRRGRLPYLGAALTSAFTLRRIVFHDARLSIQRAFKEADLGRYAGSSGLERLRFARRPFFRMVMTHEN